MGSEGKKTFSNLQKQLPLNKNIIKEFRRTLAVAFSRVAQRKRAGPITQRSMDRNHPLLGASVFRGGELL